MPLIPIPGSNIGDMTFNGGLAAAFDSNTNQTPAECARGIAGSSSAFVGKTPQARVGFGRAVIHGSNNRGFFTTGAESSVTINIRGKSGSAPASASDGTVVGTTTFTNTSDESGGRTIETTDSVTKWDHLFAEVLWGGATNGSTVVAELVIYTPVFSSQVVFFS